MDQGLALAIKAAGGRSRLAAAIGISHQTVFRWTRIPADRLIAIEQALRIPRELLRPDLYTGMARKKPL